MESRNGGEDLAEAFLAWTRHQMIHERLLGKLEEMKEDFVDEQKLSRVENLLRGEEQTIEEAKQKKIEVLRLADIEIASL
ncbi:hypothetical protein AKJ65_00885 [candidate division MSBL1 archaeon SCGC-AAA259E19]|uniref:Uncharacterized protein n=1 Tax=candidate division MSBL1 archaeon SCGC-AAA259E19 TaxID=1698264 RepID=A0A133UNQ6_9EURY|nr:hypothetical protein AKJ65_00885 [candidate division MSBL1 archaeon SCGC-AAA259E19]